MLEKRKKLLGILAVVGATIGFVALMYLVFIRPSSNLHEAAIATKGLPVGAAIDALGFPEKIYSYQDFASNQLEPISKSYNPDPPNLQCDEVWLYIVLNSMEILYVLDGKVVHVHSCGT